MRSIAVALLFILSTSVAFAADGLDSLLNVQRTRAGASAVRLFAALDDSSGHQVTSQELSDIRFLLAYLPLSDLANMDAGVLLQNDRLAHQAVKEMPWGNQISYELFRYFLLPHRVSQEPFENGWRARFLNELSPRVKNLSMTEAALEVNHWCHEQATYQADDSRDQDPFTTLRAGLGRCEEEMILAICALRSVGIPARQCYTPLWAHRDDNHAWVEVWADGKWHYFGACEPEPVLDRGWFTDAARRAMLVVSTAYGDYQGSEPVLRRTGGTTLINSTAVYGQTRDLTVTLLDRSGRPASGKKVFFSLYNYGGLSRALELETDSKGKLTLTCGLGDWFVSAGNGESGALVLVKGNRNAVTLKLDKLSKLDALTQADYLPPPAAPPSSDVQRDSLFSCRVTKEDSLRDGFWKIWAREDAISLDSVRAKPDSAWVYSFANACSLNAGKLLEILTGARGNWGHLFHFLTGAIPAAAPLDPPQKSEDLRARFALLTTLTDKDCRDFTVAALEDDYRHTTLSMPLSAPGTWNGLASLDSVSRARWADYVLAPRIGDEPSGAWRAELAGFFKPHPKFTDATADADLLQWIRDSIAVEDKPDKLGPPLTPVQTLALKRGARRDVESLFIALCRLRGIPARFNPVAGQPEEWVNGKWQQVVVKPEAEQKPSVMSKGLLTVETPTDSAALGALYYQDWAVQRWDKDHFEDVDFGFHKSYHDISWPQDLPEGHYCITSGIRQPDGSARVALDWFEIKPGKLSVAPLIIRQQ
jgi:transglutaminase-like putative cysteine protease